jgi:tRNA(Ile)-lysidine synthase
VRSRLLDLRDLPGHTGATRPLVLVAVSGGPDSLALLCAAVAVAPSVGVRVGAVTVDHAWHAGSASVAAAVAAFAGAAGCDPVDVLVAAPVSAAQGPEGDARAARYQALDACAAERGAVAVLLGHTMDDQAETVLAGLARGSGARSLSGMAPVRGLYHRPLLSVRRADVHTALPDLLDQVGAGAGGEAGAQAAGLPWADPSNTDPRHLRARVRTSALPAIEAALGPGSVEALARSAELLRADADALDGWAASLVAPGGPAAPQPDGVPVAALAGLPAAVLSRVVRLLAAQAGAGPLTAAMTSALVALATAASGSGAGPVALAGGVSARRTGGRLCFATTPADGAVRPGSGRLHPGPPAGGAVTT